MTFVALVPAGAVNDIALASAATSAQLIAANPARRRLCLTNTDANAARLRYGTTAATTSAFHITLASGAYWEMPDPVVLSAIQVIWDADGSGSLIGAEIT